MQSKFKRILFGGDYNPNQWPKEVWEQDMAYFKDVKCSQFPSCVDFTGFNCIQNCVYCYYLSFFSKIALKHRPHYFHI